MKKLLILAAVLAMASSNAFAAADPGPNGIGVYFDAAGTINCSQAAPYTPVTAYLLATNLSRGGLSGWEATLLVNPTFFGAGITLDIGAGALNVLTAPDFQVGLSPSRSGSVVTLLTITTFYLGGPIVFGVGPCIPSSFGGLSAGYADPVDPSILVPLTPSANVPWGATPIYLGSNTNLPANGPENSFVVAGVNAANCPVAVETATWGGVKDLYK